MARDFDGVDDLISYGDQAVYDLVATGSWSFWMIPASLSQTGGTICKRGNSSTQNSYAMGFGFTITPFFDVEISSDGGVAAVQYRWNATGWSTTALSHICVRFDGGLGANAKVDLFRNGVDEGAPDSVNADTTITDVFNGTANLLVGKLNETGADIFFFDGILAEAAMWNVFLSTSEIAALSRGVNPQRVRRGNLLFYDPIITTGGTADYANGVSGTITGTTIANHPPVQPPFGFNYDWQGAFTAAAAPGEGWAHLLSSTRNRLVYEAGD